MRWCWTLLRAMMMIQRMIFPRKIYVRGMACRSQRRSLLGYCLVVDSGQHLVPEEGVSEQGRWPDLVDGLAIVVRPEVVEDEVVLDTAASDDDDPKDDFPTENLCSGDGMPQPEEVSAWILSRINEGRISDLLVQGITLGLYKAIDIEIIGLEYIEIFLELIARVLRVVALRCSVITLDRDDFAEAIKTVCDFLAQIRSTTNQAKFRALIWELTRNRKKMIGLDPRERMDCEIEEGRRDND
ncbi:hypothetical protein TEA_011645 [Camellia sinensis var. sinensis]|uniref:Uncharacterized protein n=1 Tax=Camellia sinensis var. sinensis TaxID=542762 RepID=A0A4S4DDC0_CAMSN|nr:hypothetical protein TEA_011645 [Camellia sinensis var. sinensis]